MNPTGFDADAIEESLGPPDRSLSNMFSPAATRRSTLHTIQRLSAQFGLTAIQARTPLAAQLRARFIAVSTLRFALSFRLADAAALFAVG